MGMIDGLNKVHVIGAGGIGVSAVARLLRHAGKEVTGSDVAESEITAGLRSSGIDVTIGHDEANLPEGTDLVVYSGAVPEDNPERAAARRRGIPELSYFEFLGEFSKGKRTIAVSGTNGKSSTTAMLALMLVRGGLDPTVIVGSQVPSFPDRNLRIGDSDIFLVEACEHEANMLHLEPDVIVLTNIEADHLDFYRDLDHIRETFQEYVGRLPSDGLLVLNADDPVSSGGLRTESRTVTFGLGDADYTAQDIEAGEGRQTFRVSRRHPEGETSLGEFTLLLPGRFNVQNALAAIAAAAEFGVEAADLRDALAGFTGIWRRFERKGERNGAVIISDYGHHPAAIRGTLQGAREFFPGRRIVLAFQPHQHNRTKRLFDEFVASFDAADELLLVEIFDVAGREEREDGDISSRDILAAVEERDRGRGSDRPLAYAASPDGAFRALESSVGSGDLVIVMGAGDIYTVAGRLVEAPA